MSADTIESFYGVYLLYCLNPQYKGRTYIGYTVDPNRRIKQHNKGKYAGGARRTSNRGPWSMVLIIYGFPNDISALRFEWAWQHPSRSRRLHHVASKKSKERVFDYCLRILAEMLRTGPWNRLPLTVRWLNEDFAKQFPEDKPPPFHMPICYGPVISKKVTETKETTDSVISKDSCIEKANNIICFICHQIIDGKRLTCVNPECDLVSHIICLSKLFLEPGQYVPVKGMCPKCDGVFLWGDIIRKYKGCYGNLKMGLTADMGDTFYESDSD
ncbi:structure-specific endonuclease subunit slx1 [Agrilus planipennis]|uniref:Structure-specific endonuclease subunit SLX1 homolog n=1 Tax=Agrilus planipennis TaxID=224129 RepID=A0A1W4WSL2_AGRPL|nr:structure-specific endonuclease subunit slx1 [Agrilus planipennis]